MSVDQIGIFSAICNELAKQGHNKVLPRQMNVVIEAANLVVAAYEVDEIPVTAGMGLEAWLASDGVGLLGWMCWFKELRHLEDVIYSPSVRFFKTRKRADEARRTCLYPNAKVVRVTVKINVV